MDKKLIIFGTRPEFIKLLPVFAEIKRRNLGEAFIFIYTGQHNALLTELFDLFGFRPALSIPAKDHHNSLSLSYAHLLGVIQEVISRIQKTNTIKLIIGQGDTTSCACAAMAAFFNAIPFAHIEAGLRTHVINTPFPEEYFRKIISLTSTLHFTPTVLSRDHLISEGARPENVILTGNTIVDAVELVKPMALKHRSAAAIQPFLKTGNNVLITCHRRENQSESFCKLLDMVKLVAKQNVSLNFIWLLHTSPFVQSELNPACFETETNIFILPPLNILELYSLYPFLKLIITDSGGIQEEAPSFNIPVLVIREHTERNESVELGYSRLVKLSETEFLNAFTDALKEKPVQMENPYGDGKAARRIVDVLEAF